MRASGCGYTGSGDLRCLSPATGQQGGLGQGYGVDRVYLWAPTLLLIASRGSGSVGYSVAPSKMQRERQ